MKKSHLFCSIAFTIYILTASVQAQNSVWSAYFHKGLDAYQSGDLQSSEKFLKAAVTEAEKAIRDGNSEGNKMLCDTLSSLSGILGELEKYTEAETIARRAVETAKIAYGESDNQYSRALNNLGLILSYEDKFSEAESVHRQAMQLREKYDHPPFRNLAISVLNLGKVYFDQNKYLEAEALFDRVMDFFKKLKPDQAEDGDFSLMLICMRNLAMTYEKTDRIDKAKSSYEAIIGLIEIGRGKNDSSLVPVLESYAKILRIKKQNLQADKVERRLKLLKGK